MAWLAERGFVWDMLEWQWEEHVKPAIERYYAVHGNLNVPYRYVSPSSDITSKGGVRREEGGSIGGEYTVDHAANNSKRGGGGSGYGGEWGMEVNLGDLIHHIRTRDYYVRDRPERRQWLTDRGFVWEVRASKKAMVARLYKGEEIGGGGGDGSRVTVI